MKTKSNSAAPVIHYHKDTVGISNSLTKDGVYDTSKGKARFKMRSQSNGKIMFYHLETKKNIYFTKQEWIDGGNSDKNLDKDFMEQAYVQSVNSVKDAVKGLISGKSILIDISAETDPLQCSGQKAVYGGVTTNGIKVIYQFGAGLIAYFHAGEFAKRFQVIEVGTLSAKEIAERSKPKVVISDKKSKRKKR